MRKILTDLRERILFEISVAVRRVVQHEFDRIGNAIATCDQHNQDRFESLRADVTSIFLHFRKQPQDKLPEDDEKVIAARKRILVPGLTKELDSQIDWERMG